METMKRAIGVILAVGAIKGVEMFLRPDPGFPRLALALGVTLPFLAGAAALGLIAGTWWVVLRLDGKQAVRPRRIAPGNQPSRPLTALERQLARGRSAAAVWLVGGFVVVVILADTRLGPPAWAASVLPGGPTWLATFALGLAMVATPLLLLAVLPRQSRWPVLAGAQDVVKSPAAPRRRRR